jgi:hypothetical protein
MDNPEENSVNVKEHTESIPISIKLSTKGQTQKPFEKW